MPTRGSLTSKIPDDAGPELRAWVDKLRTVYDLLPRRSMAFWAKQLHLATSTLSRYLKGTRRPEERAVVEIYRLADKHQKEYGSAMPFPLRELLSLRQAALGSRTGRRAVAPVPAADAAGTTALVPVPRRLPDRHDAAGGWDGAEAVARLTEAGQLRAAHVLLAETGRTGTPATVCAAAASLRQRGLDDAADTLLLAAGQRSDRERTAILSALNRGHRFQDIEVVLRAAENLLGAAA